MMVLMAKLPSKLLPLASVYRPTAQVHAANDALMVQGYKHMTGISRHAHTTPGALGAWLLGFDPVLTLVAGRGRPGMGPAGSLGQGGLSGVPDLHPPGTPSAQRGVPCHAYPGAVHPPPAVPPPHRHAAAGGG